MLIERSEDRLLTIPEAVDIDFGGVGTIDNQPVPSRYVDFWGENWRDHAACQYISGHAVRFHDNRE